MMDALKTVSGSDFRAARRLKNITQQALASELGLATSTIVRWESSLSLPMAALAAYQQLFGQSAAPVKQRKLSAQDTPADERTVEQWVEVLDRGFDQSKYMQTADRANTARIHLADPETHGACRQAYEALYEKYKHAAFPTSAEVIAKDQENFKRKGE